MIEVKNITKSFEGRPVLKISVLYLKTGNQPDHRTKRIRKNCNDQEHHRIDASGQRTNPV